MREAKDRLDEIGARAIAVAEGEPARAQRLMDEGMPFPLLLDPENQVRHIIGAADRIPLRNLLHPRGAIAYLKAWRRARFLRVTLSQATQRPGAAVLDAQLNVTWTHIGRRVGDYPDLEVVITELRRAS